MRVALVYPPFDDKRDRSAYYVAPPLGLLLIAACLEQLGHEVKVYDFILDLKAGRLSSDPEIYEQCAARIAVDEPQVVCISTQCTTNPGALNICRQLKALCPRSKTLLGGHDVSFLARDYLERFQYVDFVLAGEAERTVPMLLEALSGERAFGAVPGLAFRNDRGSIHVVPGTCVVGDLDLLPRPAYHLVAPLAEYFSYSRRPTILIDSGRGCAFKCEFCQTTLLSGESKIRYRSINSLVSELADYRARHGEYEAYFVHDLFTAKRAFVEAFCQALIAADLGISWQCRCRVDQVDEELLALMKRAGCRMLLYGIESGAESTLIMMNKNLRKSARPRVFERVKSTVAAGIFPSLSMVVGIPEESLRDVNATMKLASDFITLGNVNAFIQLMSPLPGTALANRLLDRMEYKGQQAPTAFNQGIEFDAGRRVKEDEELIAAHPEIFQSFQCVVPDHGDLSICIDVTLAYCKLLEVYNRSFRRLAEVQGTDHLGLFRAFRDWYLRTRSVDSFYGAKDMEIWDGFRKFFEEVLYAAPSSVRLELEPVLTFDLLLNSISTAMPVDACPPRSSAPRFRLRSAAKLIATTKEVIDGGGGAQTPASRFLVFATRDRINTVELSEDMFETLELLEELATVDAEDHVFSAIRVAVAPLEPFNVFEDLEANGR